ncbi:MAG TPA: penicillin-binding protein 2 [Acidimicrobiales bacterium]|jgi:peptidoglycan glycosyltransferase|nr:penicillin-binding protein 2 [Acidimicrobiales bacterium]
MNRQIRLLGAGLMALFIGLFVQLNYLQIVHANALNTNPLNGEAVVKEYTAQRGNIISADGVTLASSTPTKDQFKYLRSYPTGSLFAQITGYFSFTYGSDGAERTYDKILTGKKSPFRLPTSIQGIKSLLTNNNVSQSITLTVLDRLQKVAQSELTGRLGSVVALNPKTGAILAMYSNPTFDPNQLASHNLTQVAADYKAISHQTGGPLDPPAYRQTWFPGSSFKIITSAAVYDHNSALANQVQPTLSALPLPQTTTQLHNFAGEVCGGNLLELFTVSCDTGFGQLGLTLGAQNLYDEANSFGFDQVPPLDLPFGAKSNFPSVASFKDNLPTLAYSAIGQEDVQASPLEMALVAGGIANGGDIMAPHILDHVTNSQNQTVETYSPSKWISATSATTAASVTQLMEAVVNSPNGTGTAAAIPGITVAGKTGTAQTGTNLTDDWFVAFAPAQNPTIALAVVLPNQGASNDYTGGAVAAPIAKAMIEAYLGSATSNGSTPSTVSPNG